MAYDVTNEQSFQDIEDFWMGEVAYLAFRWKSLQSPTCCQC